MPLKLTINGQIQDFDLSETSTTLAQLVDKMELKADRVAIEHNGVIAPRTAWAHIEVRQGDKLEIVHFVGGGSGQASNEGIGL